MAYVIPTNAGLASEPRAVGRRIGRLLDDIDSLNTWAIIDDTAGIRTDLYNFKYRILDMLHAEGWRVTVNARDKWQVLPPK